MGRDRLTRVLVGYAALLVVALAVAAATAAPGSSGSGLAAAAPVARTGLEVAVGLLLAGGLALLSAAVARRPRRRRPDDELPLSRLQPPSRLARALALLVAVLVLAGVVLLVVVLARTQHATQPPVTIQPGGRNRASEPPLPTPAPGSGHSDVVLVAVIVAAVLLLAGLAVAVSAWRRRHSTPVEPAPTPGAAPPDALSAALDDGAAALARGATARSAIIACYQAMRRALISAGADATPADTPEELLDRATRAGLARPDPAQRLTVLFHEARFSAHPMRAAQREEAADALAALRRALSARAR